MKFHDLSDLQQMLAVARDPVGMKTVLLLLIAWSAMQSDQFFNDGKSLVVINDAFPNLKFITEYFLCRLS